jgi:predicted fused transcriptional regulator/phosphomethylpyrimidine kinase
LLAEDARECLKKVLLPLARVVTPNLPEAEVLCGFPVRNLAEMEAAARTIHAMGPKHVIVKGGHLEGRAVDLLFDGEHLETYDAPRLNQNNTHGTGCTFSAALATFLGQGLSIRDAVIQAKRFITRAIAAGLDIGAGHGPTDPYAHIRVLEDREHVLNSLGEALQRLEDLPLGRLIPEARANLAFAVPGAMDYSEVAGIPGRISRIGNRVVACRGPAFGATRHIARVILSVMQSFPDVRSAMNILYSNEILTACRAAGFISVGFDRRGEPRELREREDACLDWGTLEALAGLDQAPDIVYDEGDMGKEPMIRVLGVHPAQVVDKVNRIYGVCSS